MADERSTGPLEFRLLLACVLARPESEDAIREMLGHGVDWTRFARMALDHEVAGLAGQALTRAAPGILPEDILDAFGVIVDQARGRNRVQFDELGAIAEALAKDGVEAIPLGGPLLAIEQDGGIGPRQPGSLCFLVREPAAAIAILRGLGYERRKGLSPAQLALIHRLQGRDILFRKDLGTAVTPCTRLTPLNMALGIDHAALWRRARRKDVNGRTFLLPQPEDGLLMLAIEGGVASWCSLKLVCDVAAFLGSHPELDWAAAIGRARAQGCLRVLLLATRLARHYLDSGGPDVVVAAEGTDPVIEPMMRRIAARWHADGPTEPTDDNALSMDRLLLHDGVVPRARYLARTALLPQPRHVAWAALPRSLGLAYVPIKMAHDIAALPIWHRDRPRGATAGKSADAAAPPPGPRTADAWMAYATGLYDSQHYAEAVEACDRVLGLDPGHVAATRMGIHARQHSCDWSRRKEDIRRVTDGLSAGLQVISPFFHRALCDSGPEHLALARLLARRYPCIPEASWPGERRRHDKIRIGYMSVELHDPTTTLIAGVFEHHDRTRFETTAIALGPDDGSAMRRRIKAAFNRFINVNAMTDDEAAAALRELEIDIVVDLKGNAGDRRSGVLARRPAPVQVSYLGYPGTMGVSFIDYIIADRILIQEEQRVHYSEKVVYLPHSYMATDDKAEVAERTPGRAEAGLPETGFVFASFNNTYKIGPDIFDRWMRLLRAVEGSVLWLRGANTAAMSNLRREARARGVAPERLVFASYMRDRADYLARQRLADLFLDTLPFNAHATAADALWAGLPVLTCQGNTSFARVAASLLHAVGLPELVTSSLTEYEGLALALARDPGRLAAIRAKLIRNRDTRTLFDTAGTTRDLEAAYTMMWERAQRGEPPESFSVPAMPALDANR